MADTETPITSSIVDDGKALMQRLQDKIDSKNISDSVKASLIQERTAIQSILDDVFMKSGIINQSQVDSVNSIFDNTKQKLLQIQAKDTNNRILIWGGVAILAIGGFMWYNKNK
jgi:hypothetical protein